MKFNRLIPELYVSDYERIILFYTKILGFCIVYEREESKFAMISLQGSQIMIQQATENWKTGDLEYPFGRGVNFQNEVDKLAPIFDNIRKNNYHVFVEPADSLRKVKSQFVGDREFLVKDPDGYLIRFSENIGTRPL